LLKDDEFATAFSDTQANILRNFERLVDDGLVDKRQEQENVANVTSLVRSLMVNLEKGIANNLLEGDRRTISNEMFTVDVNKISSMQYNMPSMLEFSSDSADVTTLFPIKNAKKSNDR
jgi:DNA-binding transcriptional MocR family regulator